MRLPITALVPVLLSVAVAPATGQEARPDHRFGAAAAFDAARSRLILFGGMGMEEREPQGDTWEFDGEHWVAMTPEHSPSARAFATMAYDAGRGRVVLFGGASNTEAFGDTWEWDGRSWVERPGPGPAARMMADLVYDPGTGRVLLVGGMHPQSEIPFDDVWAWDGSAWVAVDPGVEFEGMTLAERRAAAPTRPRCAPTCATSRPRRRRITQIT